MDFTDETAQDLGKAALAQTRLAFDAVDNARRMLETTEQAFREAGWETEDVEKIGHAKDILAEQRPAFTQLAELTAGAWERDREHAPAGDPRGPTT